jgi:hypothetical protein
MGVQTPVARSAINSLTKKGFKILELKVGKILDTRYWMLGAGF